jgi:transcriptional regulator with XRE-family HTH domain
MHSLLSELLGKYILQERKNRRITQRKLAEMVDCSEQFLGRIESGAVMTPDRILLSCIKILGLRYEKLKKIYRQDSDQRIETLFNQASSIKKNA